MFNRLLKWIRRAVSIILPTKELTKEIGVDIAISDEMVDSIERWTAMYEDNPYWLNDRTHSLNIAASVASEMARLVTIEMISEITGDKGKRTARSEFINVDYQKVIDKLRVQTEYAVAKGGLIFKPYFDGERIAVDFVQADEFYPVKFNSSGDLIAVIFPEIITRDNFTYTRLEYHEMLNEKTPENKSIYYISNKAYVKQMNTEGLGRDCSLQDVEEWADLEEELNLYGVEKPLFSYFKAPIANNKDSRSHLGVSVFGKAEKLIEQADKQYSKILWEYEGTELAVDVSADMLIGGLDMPKGAERLFRGLESADENLYKVYSPTIRDESLFNGLNKLLQRIEFNCGLAYGTLSDMEETAKTATEIKTSKQRSYSTVVDIQKALRIALEQLVMSMEFLVDMYKLTDKGEIFISFSFDDSIIIDSKEEQAIMLQEVSAGLIKPEKYLMQRYGVSEEEAAEMLPDMDVELYDDLE